MTVVGCGYTGRRLLKLCRAAGRDFFGTVRSAASLQELASLDARAGILDLDAAGGPMPREWLEHRAVIYTAPPPGTGTTDPRIRRFLARLSAAPATLVYLSTTGVYGDTAGNTVDEDTPPAPGSERGQRRLDAERALHDWSGEAGARLRILRVPGIYGPGRLPLDRLRQGAPVLRDEEAGAGNRIHVDDLAAVSLAAADHAGPEQLFNVGDGCHASMSEYFRLVARAAGLPEPPQLPLAELLARVSPAMRSFLVESRRVDTSRMRTVLGYQPRFSDLETGVMASLAAQAD